MPDRRDQQGGSRARDPEHARRDRRRYLSPGMYRRRDRRASHRHSPPRDRKRNVSYLNRLRDQEHSYGGSNKSGAKSTHEKGSTDRHRPVAPPTRGEDISDDGIRTHRTAIARPATRPTCSQTSRRAELEAPAKSQGSADIGDESRWVRTMKGPETGASQGIERRHDHGALTAGDWDSAAENALLNGQTKGSRRRE